MEGSWDRDCGVAGGEGRQAEKSLDEGKLTRRQSRWEESKIVINTVNLTAEKPHQGRLQLLLRAGRLSPVAMRQWKGS